MMKNILRKIFPPKEKYDWVQQYPDTAGNTKQGIRELCLELLRLTGGKVFSGPFAGMDIPEGSHLRSQPNAIIGTYEQEIHDIINETVCNPPTCVVDIGAAGGFYVAGLARLIPDITVIAFEMNEMLWPEIERIASANSIHRNRIQIHGCCTADALANTVPDGALVICDCEGAERDILDPSLVPTLATCTILCELHDFLIPEANLTATLVARFRKSHTIEIRCESPRNPDDYRILRHLPEHIRHVACDETRHISNPFRLTAARFMILKPRRTSE